jgi:glycosyltransferase involved in cell wall biosynthesis
MPIALVTNYLPPYRLPLYELLAERYGIEVYCFGGEGDYVPVALRDLDTQLAAARFPAHRLKKQRSAADLAASHDAVIASTSGRVALPAAFRGARRAGKPFILWASLWRHPRTLAHLGSFVLMRRLYRYSDAIVTYGSHVSRYVAGYRGSERGVFAAAQAVEPELFGRAVPAADIEQFRVGLGIEPDEPIVLFAGRLVPEKGVETLLGAWRASNADGHATLCMVGDGPLSEKAAALRGVRVTGRIERELLPIAYAAANVLVVPSLRTRRFLEPWGLVCNEAMFQATPVIASDAVGATAGGLVRDGETGVVVPAGNQRALAGALVELIGDRALQQQLGENGRELVAEYSYESAAAAFGDALRAAGVATS